MFALCCGFEPLPCLESRVLWVRTSPIVVLLFPLKKKNCPGCSCCSLCLAFLSRYRIIDTYIQLWNTPNVIIQRRATCNRLLFYLHCHDTQELEYSTGHCTGRFVCSHLQQYPPRRSRSQLIQEWGSRHVWYLAHHQQKAGECSEGLEEIIVKWRWPLMDV